MMNIQPIIELVKKKQSELYKIGELPDDPLRSLGCGYATAVLSELIKELEHIEIYEQEELCCGQVRKTSMFGTYEYCLICEKKVRR